MDGEEATLACWSRFLFLDSDATGFGKRRLSIVGLSLIQDLLFSPGIITSVQANNSKLQDSNILFQSHVKMLFLKKGLATLNIPINIVVSGIHFVEVNLSDWLVIWNIFGEVIVRFESLIMCRYSVNFGSEQLQIKFNEPFGFLLFGWRLKSAIA